MISNPVRVLVVDDSAYLRKAISSMLMRSPFIEVVGTARDGSDALEKVAELDPDVITLDLFMPVMDGVSFLREQMARRPVPAVIVSIADEFTDNFNAAMEAGAVEFVRKPTARAHENVYEISEDLIQKVLVAAQVPRTRLGVSETLPEAVVSPPEKRRGTVDAVVIGISTGGPQALRKIIPRFPAEFPVPVAVVLHMPIGYTGPLAGKLDELSQVQVLEACEGLQMKPGRVILAQAGFHLILKRESGDQVIAHLDLKPDDLPHRPSVDALFRSAADVYGQKTLGIVLTGMGNDGSQGAAWIKAQGGLVFTEAEESSVVYGMPRSVVELGLSDKIIPLDRVVDVIMETI